MLLKLTWIKNTENIETEKAYLRTMVMNLQLNSLLHFVKRGDWGLGSWDGLNPTPTSKKELVEPSPLSKWALAGEIYGSQIWAF